MNIRSVRFVSLLLFVPALALAQSTKAATYITDEQVKAINSLPGVDRQIITTDIGKLNLSVGIVHRGATNAATAAPVGGAAAAQQGQRLWVVDPIDGTRGFARKNGEFSLMVAFVDGGRIGVGVVLEPAQERLTYATAGGGCWRVMDWLTPGRSNCTMPAASAVPSAVHTRLPSGSFS